MANYILMDYGTGAIMSVPAHDDRDYEFAKKYKIDIRLVIVSYQGDRVARPSLEPRLPFTTEDGPLINSGPFSGLTCDEAKKQMAAYAEKNGFGKATVTYRLKDWGISRQRYWGTPIPDALLRERRHRASRRKRICLSFLPDNVDITLTGGSPLSRVPGFRQRDLPEVRWSRAARDRYHGHLRRLVLVFLSLHRRTQPQSAIRFARRPPTGFPSTNTSAALSMPFCT